MLYPKLCYNKDSVPDFFSKKLIFKNISRGPKSMEN